MAREKIPAHEVVTCDRCGKVCKGAAPGADCPPFKKETHVRVRAHGLDLVGDAVGPDEEDFDLCDPCAAKVRAAIVAVLEEGDS